MNNISVFPLDMTIGFGTGLCLNDPLGTKVPTKTKTINSVWSITSSGTHDNQLQLILDIVQLTLHIIRLGNLKDYGKV